MSKDSRLYTPSRRHLYLYPEKNQGIFLLHLHHSIATHTTFYVTERVTYHSKTVHIYSLTSTSSSSFSNSPYNSLSAGKNRSAILNSPSLIFI